MHFAGFQDALLATARRGQSKPVIVNVNSFGGRIPLRNMAAYSASKFALAGAVSGPRASFKATSHVWVIVGQSVLNIRDDRQCSTRHSDVELLSMMNWIMLQASLTP